MDANTSTIDVSNLAQNVGLTSVSLFFEQSIFSYIAVVGTLNLSEQTVNLFSTNQMTASYNCVSINVTVNADMYCTFTFLQ